MGKQQEWKRVLKADPTEWLLEPGDPGVRYLALRDIVEAGAGELAAAHAHIQEHRFMPSLLDKLFQIFDLRPLCI
jgi:hypothetical protein